MCTCVTIDNRSIIYGVIAAIVCATVLLLVMPPVAARIPLVLAGPSPQEWKLPRAFL